MLSKKTYLLTAIIIMFSLVLGACQPAASSGNEIADNGQKEVIKFSDTQFQTLWINNAIAAFIIEHGYGYPTETVEMATAVMQQSLADGDVDVHMELWRMNIWDWYQEVTSSGDVLDLGDTYEKSTQGFYVPRYVIEGDSERGIEPMAPDLKSVFDLPKYKELFKDPEDPSKGLLINCITGWQCATVNRAKMHAYGLDDEFNILDPGASAALDAAIAGAYEKGNPILAYYWEPTWLLGMYDMVQLEEPAYNDACWEEISAFVNDTITMDELTENAGCAYETIGIHKGVHKSLKERAPEVVAFLEKMNVGTDPLNKTAAYMSANETEADEAAIWFLENYSERWHEWVSADVAEKVEAALAEAKS